MGHIPLKANMNRLVSDYGNGDYVDLCDVYIQDQTSEIVDLFLGNNIDTATLAANTSIGDRVITLVAGHGAVVGNEFRINEGSHFYQGEVIAVSGNDITIDSPLDFPFTAAGAELKRGTADMNVDGSTTPVIFQTSPPVGTSWDITRMFFIIRDDSAMDDALFGGISALTNGVVVRKKDSIYKNYFNIKSNGDFALRAYDVVYADKAPSGYYGLRCRRSFAGQDKNGVTVRLNGDDGDRIQVIIQDDLTDLYYFRVVVQGHVVQ